MSAVPLGDAERVVERLARIEARLEHMATREDLANFETRMLRWVASFLGFGTLSLIIGVTRTFF